MIANRLFCPLCGKHLDTLPSSTHSWLMLTITCSCGANINASHIDNDPCVGLQVGALVVEAAGRSSVRS
jgi:hypothetical protein